MKQLSFILLLLFANYAGATNVIYVTPSSKVIHGDGSLNNPFTSIEEAYDIASGIENVDTIFIRLLSGTYELDKTIVIDKPSKRPVVIEGFDVDNTILSGAISSKFEKGSNTSMWKTNIPEVKRYGLKVEQLYVNGQRSIRARTPDVGQFYLEGSEETVHYRGNDRAPEYATQKFMVNKKDVQSLKGMSLGEVNDVMVMFYHHWDNTRKYLSNVYPDSSYIFIHGAGLKPWNPITKGSRYVLENYRNALSMPGEWFISPDGELSYIPRVGETVDNSIIQLPVLTTLLSIEGKEGKPIRNITFRNISFQHSAYVMPKIGNDASQAAAGVNAAIEVRNASGVTFVNCEVKNTGNYGMWFRKSSNNCSVRESYFYDLGAGGIKIGEGALPQNEAETVKHIIVENNIIQKTGSVFPCGVGVVIFQASDNKILHNEISDLMYSGISVGWTWGYGKSCAVNNEIAYNHIHHIGWGELSDMGAIYTLGKSPGTRIHNNVVHDVYSYDYGGWGLYTDEGSSDIVLENNLVYACKSGGFHQHYGKDNIIRNNIFAYGHFYQLQFTKAEEHCSFHFTNNIVLMDCGTALQGPWDKAKVDMKNNSYWDLREKEKGTYANMSFEEWKKKVEKTAVWADPMFVDAQKGNFDFKSKKTIKKIGFKPFDYKKAGVYGSKSWIEKAKMKPYDIERFRQIILKREKEHAGYYDNSLYRHTYSFPWIKITA